MDSSEVQDRRNMRKIVSIIGYSILSFVVLFYFTGTLFVSYLNFAIIGLAMLGVIIGILFGLYFEGRKLVASPFSHPYGEEDLHNFIAVFSGAILTFFISHYLGLGAVVAAALVAIGFDALMPDHGVPAYCGAFIGMTSELIFSTPEVVLISACLVGVIYVLTTDSFGGFGGKLGTVAFSSLILAMFSQTPITPVAAIPLEYGWLIVAAAIFGSVASYYISIELSRGAVFASGFIGLLSGLLIPPIFPEIGNILAVMLFCASFAGMSTDKRFPHTHLLAIVGAVIGLSFIFSASFLVGYGGKLGTIAFGSGIAVRGYIDLYKSWTPEGWEFFSSPIIEPDIENLTPPIRAPSDSFLLDE